MSTAEERIKFAVKKATSGDELLEVDWAANIAIIDMLNQSPQLCRVVAQQLEKRICRKSADDAVLAISLLEGIMKNVETFHRYANDMNFLNALADECRGTVKPKSKFGFITQFMSGTTDENPRKKIEKVERLLVLIEAWGKAFQHVRGYPNFSLVYARLKSEGIRFPEPLPDEAGPVFLPPSEIQRGPSKKALDTPSVSTPAPEPQGNDLVSDASCKACLDNVNLLRSMINASDDNPSSNDLVQELLGILRDAQANIMRRINLNPSDLLLGDLLLANDSIIDVINFYTGVEQGTMAREIDSPRRDTDGTSEDEAPAHNLDIFDFTNTSMEVTPIAAPKSKKATTGAEFIPKIAPPPTATRTRRASVEKAEASGEADDLLDLFSAPISSIPPSASPAAASFPISDQPQVTSDEDFFAIAMLKDDQPQPSKPQNSKPTPSPFDDLFQ